MPKLAMARRLIFSVFWSTTMLQGDFCGSLHFFVGAGQWGDSTAVFGIFDQAGETGLAGFFFLGADDPMNGGHTIGVGLSLKERPGCGVGLKLGERGLVELGEMALFVGVDARFLCLSKFKGFETFRAHEAESGEFSYLFDVDFAPVAVGLARSETDFVAFLVNAFSQTVNPAKAKGLINGFGPGDAGEARLFFIKANPEFFRLGVVFFEPGAEIGGGGEKEGRGFHVSVSGASKGASVRAGES